MKTNEALKKHLLYRDKSMPELIEERNLELMKRQNELRKKYLPEKYNPNLGKQKNNNKKSN